MASDEKKFHNAGAKDVHKLDVPPGDWGFPLIGDTAAFVRDPLGTLNARIQDNSGSVFKTSLLNERTAIAHRYNSVAEVLEGSQWFSFSHFLGYDYLFRDTFGKMLFSSDSEEDSHMLSALFSKALSSEAVESYAPAVVRIARAHMSTWSDDKPRQLYVCFRELFREVSLAVILGIEGRTADLRDLAQLSSDSFSGAVALPIKFNIAGFKSPHSRGKEATHKLREYISNRLTSALRWRRKRLRLDASKQVAPMPEHKHDLFVGYVAEAYLTAMQHHRPAGLSEEELDTDENVWYQFCVTHLTLFVTGLVPKVFGSHAASLCWEFGQASNRNWLRDCVKEARDVLPLLNDMANLRAPGTRQPPVATPTATPSAVPQAAYTSSLSSIMQLPHLNACREETLRLHPPVVGGARGTAEVCPLGIYKIPQGYKVWFSLYHANRDESTFECAGEFRPGRWMVSHSDTQKEAVTAAASEHDQKDSEAASAQGNQPKCPHFAFGAGPRGCKGRFMATVFTQLVMCCFLSEYSFFIAPEQDLDIKLFPTLRHNDGLKAKIRPRPFNLK